MKSRGFGAPMRLIDCPKILLAAAVVFAFAANVSVSMAQSLGTFTTTGSMSIPRISHTATLLANGKVLIVGGDDNGQTQALGSAELYDPNTGTFTPTGNMTTPLPLPTATLLNDGRVLIVGRPYDGCENTAELYDPATGTFSKTGGTATHQVGGRAILLDDGRVLVAGGISGITDCLSDRLPVATPELYDPSTGTFVPTGPFATAGINSYYLAGPDVSAVSLLPDGRVLIAAELNSELYNPVNGTFSQTSPMTTICGFGPERPGYISGRTGTLLASGKVLLTGGEHEDCGRYATVELYDPLDEKFHAAGAMSRTRANHSATLLPDGTVFIAGGDTSNCVGGRCYRDGTTASVESYDPLAGRLTVLDNMVANRAGHTATVLMDGTVLIAGGYSYGPFGTFGRGMFPTAEIYTPPVPLPTPVVTELQIDRSSVAVGDSFTANFAGSNVTPDMFFDVRFTAPGSNQSNVGLNWQRDLTSDHTVSAGITPGVWTINGVRAHRFEDDHSGNFFPVTATIVVVP
jgi:Galactose oxidase, central domain